MIRQALAADHARLCTEAAASCDPRSADKIDGWVADARHLLVFDRTVCQAWMSIWDQPGITIDVSRMQAEAAGGHMPVIITGDMLFTFDRGEFTLRIRESFGAWRVTIVGLRQPSGRVSASSMHGLIKVDWEQTFKDTYDDDE
jgi:hypothetical protein